MTEPGITPSQTAGPYLRIGLLRNILTPNVVDPGDARAIRIRGRLTDAAGDGVPDGMIETWQANAAGRYHHPADERDERPARGRLRRLRALRDGGRRPLRDRHGQARARAVARGWPAGAAHRGVTVFARGLLKHAVTRLYFPDETEANAEDPVLSRLPPEQRDTLVAVAEDGGLRFDIRLQGPSHTTFFAV